MVKKKFKLFFKKNALKSCFEALVKADGSAQAMSITTASRGKSRGLQIFLHGQVAEILYSGLPNAWLQKHNEKPTCDFEAGFFPESLFCTGRMAVFCTGRVLENRRPLQIFSKIHAVFLQLVYL